MQQTKTRTPASPSNTDLIARAQDGDAEAFEQLFHRHKQRVYSLCLRVAGNTAEAEDMTQDAFLQVFRKIHTFRGESAFSTWLHRLALNTALMRLRKKTLTMTPLETSFGEDEPDEPQAELGGPDLALVSSIDRVHLQRAIAQLPPGYRRAFLLHDVQGYRHPEIAAMLGMSIGNSKSQLHKARLSLRRLLREGNSECRRQKEPRAPTMPETPATRCCLSS